jgi:hypothetical protein
MINRDVIARKNLVDIGGDPWEISRYRQMVCLGGPTLGPHAPLVDDAEGGWIESGV